MRCSIEPRAPRGPGRRDVGEEALDAAEDLVEDAVVDRLGHPPRRLLLRAGRGASSRLSSRNAPSPRGRRRAAAGGGRPRPTTSIGLAEQRGDVDAGAGGARPSPPRASCDVAVVEHLDDAAAWRRRRRPRPARRCPARRASRRGARPTWTPCEPLGEHLAGEEVALHELAEAAPDLVLALRDDRRVRDRQAERVAEQRGDGEPVGERADHRRLGGRPARSRPRPGRRPRTPGRPGRRRRRATSSPVANNFIRRSVAAPAGSSAAISGSDTGRTLPAARPAATRSAACRPP